MRKEDYMKLSKERLAELLVEQESTLEELRNLLLRSTTPPFVIQQARPLCYEEGGTCTYPQMDCVNCPKLWRGGSYTTSTDSTGKKP